MRFCVEDWFNNGVVANIRDHSIQEIWKSPIYERFRELHRNAGTVTGLHRAHKQAWLDGWGKAFPANWRHHVRDLNDAG